MKINKTNPLHLLILLISLFGYIYVVIKRTFFFKKNTSVKTVVFYGHTLNGNLRAFYDYLNSLPTYSVYFLGLDKHYLMRLENNGEPLDKLLSVDCIKDLNVLAQADAIITSHGLHLLSIVRRLTNIKFFDVWHGIPYKGFDEEDSKHLHNHTQTWVSSPKLKEIYINRLGFQENRVKVTGYARVDQLIDGSLNKKDLLDKYNIRSAEKHILIAPTWAQDTKGRSIVPFGVTEGEFFNELDEIARAAGAVIIFRTHLNSSDNLLGMDKLKNTLFMPYSKYENAEEFLYIADMLITDWSSIAFDYLPLHRPTIFLDVTAPFKKGFTLGPEYRFGEVVASFSNLKKSTKEYLDAPETYLTKHLDKINCVENDVYGKTLDGKSAARYEHELRETIAHQS